MNSCYSCHSTSLVITSEDDLVCTDCGRVNEETVSCDYVTPSRETYHIPQEHDTWEISNHLLDVFARFMIPTFVTDKVLLQYSKLRTELKTRYSSSEIAAYATYQILIEEKIPRLLSEIADYFNLERSKLRRLASEQWQSDVNPIDLISPALAKLTIPFYLRHQVEHEIDIIRKYSAARPETVLACGIFRVVKRTPYRDLKSSDIACACGVSTASLRSLNAQTRRSLKSEIDNAQEFYLR